MLKEIGDCDYCHSDTVPVQHTGSRWLCEWCWEELVDQPWPADEPSDQDPSSPRT